MKPQLPLIATVLSLIACYGTLIVLAALAALGLAVGLNEAVWAWAIVLFAGMAVFGLIATRRRHGRSWPLVLGITGLCLLVYVMFANYARMTEIAGFILLLIAVVADRRMRAA